MQKRSNSGENPAAGGGLDELERLLSRQRFRSPPLAWRDFILAGATAGDGLEREQEREQDSERRDRSSRGPGRLVRLGFWPEWLRSGWTVVGAAWAVAWMLHGAAMPVHSSARPARPPLSAAARAELAAQMAVLSESSLSVGGWAVVSPGPGAPAQRSGTSSAPPAAAEGRPRAGLRKPEWERIT